MTPILTTALFTHIIFGVLAVTGMYSIWMMLLKRESNAINLKRFSAGSLISILISWFSGAYYYLTYYGVSIKPVIKKGAYPWAHNIVMEAKEHIFLFLPFLLTVALIAFMVFGSRLNQSEKLKKSLTFLVAIMTIIGIAITFSGLAISGSVR